MHVVTFPSPMRWPGHLLSRYPVCKSGLLSPPGHVTPVASAPYSRSAGVALLAPCDAGRLQIYALHLHPHDRALRDREAAVLDDVLEREASDDDTIVLGDFNCAPAETIHQVLTARGFVNAVASVDGRLSPTRQLEVGGSRPAAERTVDHIYVSAALATSLHSAKVIGVGRFALDTRIGTDAWAHSDHLPVVAELAPAGLLNAL
jgi:endonuclease/exonuclease/phosphatase family metal-dependent hydrolase